MLAGPQSPENYGGHLLQQRPDTPDSSSRLSSDYDRRHRRHSPDSGHHSSPESPPDSEDGQDGEEEEEDGDDGFEVREEEDSQQPEDLSVKRQPEPQILKYHWPCGWQDPLEYNYWKPMLSSLSPAGLQYRNIEDLATAQAILDLR